ncbi:unnamed protein product [Adineta ricciae]|nr:unnamed protein product [Adineta ricciae]
MNHYEIPRQPPSISLLLTLEKNSSQITLPTQQKQVPEMTTSSTPRPQSQNATPIDWKSRYDILQAEHKLECERIRLYYEQQLQERVTEVKTRLQREYEQQISDYRARLIEQQRLTDNLSSSSLGLDHSYGDQVREQVRLAEELDRIDDERRQTLMKHATNNDELQHLVNKLHTEGVHVLTLSELLALRLNGINIQTTGDSVESLQKLHEENVHLRTLIANMNKNGHADQLIKDLANVFRCEQERRLVEVRQHPNFDLLEQDINTMGEYQREALEKFFSQDRLSPSKKYYLKYLRCENYRKALIYQKRYLLILLTGYADTETYALNEIRRLTGDIRANAYSHSYQSDRMKSIRKQSYHRRLFDPRFRFRCYVRTVIVTIRMRCLVRKWTKTVASIKIDR